MDSTVTQFGSQPLYTPRRWPQVNGSLDARICHHLFRAKYLLTAMRQHINQSKILEIGPLEGWFTDVLLSMGADKIVAVEASSTAFENFSRRFEPEIESGQIYALKSDIHIELYNFPPKNFDIVVCTGFLYHSPHALWILEGLSRLRPKFVLLETFNDNDEGIRLTSYQPNTYGGRNCSYPHLSMATKMTQKFCYRCMADLGYKPCLEIDKRDLFFDELNLDRNQLVYMNQWRDSQFSTWFVTN